MKTEVAAVILAAGKGSRIGTPKLKLKMNGRSFLELIAANLKKAGIDKMLCVVSPADREWTEGKGFRFQVAVNPRPEQGMISSLFCGLQNLQEVRGVMVVPVDHPLVRVETYSALIMAFRKYPRSVIKPAYRDKPGHPVIIPRHLASMVPALDIRGGLGALIAHSRTKQVTVPVTDPGIIQNVNTSTDLDFFGWESQDEPKHL